MDRVWLAQNSNDERVLRLCEADGWVVNEAVKAPVYPPNSPQDIRQSMDLLREIHNSNWQDAHERAAHNAISCALDEAGIKNEVHRGMCLEVGLEKFVDSLRHSATDREIGEQ